MNAKIFKKWSFRVFALLLIIIFGSVWKWKQVSYSVIVDAPVEKVWSYVSDSSNAKDWSVYFDHISSLPGVEDGRPGSIRRCFRNADEEGAFWDEEVVKVRENEYREIRTFNLNGFGDPDLKKTQFKVQQIFEKLESDKTKLTFTSEYSGPMDFSTLKALVPAAAEAERIFRLNLENIKSLIEGGERTHLYEAKNMFDPEGP